MDPYLNDSDFTLYVGDVRDVLAELEPESVDCVITSPPYWGLRDYGTGEWEGGDEGCDHRGQIRMSDATNIGRSKGKDRRLLPDAPSRHVYTPYRNVCGKCGARRKDHQLGLEPTPDEYVQNMVEVFRQVRRVLAPHGTCWVNLGDSYAAGKSGRDDGHRRNSMGVFADGEFRERHAGGGAKQRSAPPGFKPKDLVGIPWRLAFALQQPYYTGRIKKETDRVWLAATVEAEGCMFIHRRGVGQYASSYTRNDGTEVDYHRKNASYGAGLEVASTDRVIVERCLEITGIGSICEQSPEANRRRKQTIYRWNVRSNECRWVIRELYPHLLAKRHEARLLLGCPSSGDDARKAWESLKALHQGQSACIDFREPEGMWEGGWFLRSDIIWAKLFRTRCRSP